MVIFVPVVMQFEFRQQTPRRWLISAQGWSLRQPWDYKSTVLLNPARVRLLANAFSVLLLFLIGFPGLKLANAFGVVIPKIKLHH
jgi:hypothetical protein